MVHPLVKSSQEMRCYTDTLRRSIRIQVPKYHVWKIIGNISCMPSWATGVVEAPCTSKKRTGVGAIRVVRFDDNREIEEHVVIWNNKESLTYVATNGLPLRAYVATMTLKQISQNKEITEVIWESYMNSVPMTKSDFKEFYENMRVFYDTSLEKLKRVVTSQKRS